MSTSYSNRREDKEKENKYKQKNDHRQQKGEQEGAASVAVTQERESGCATHGTRAYIRYLLSKSIKFCC